MENSRPKLGRMEETLEGGRGPPRAVEPLERERERVSRMSQVHGELRPFLHLHRKILVVPDRHFEELWNMLQCFLTTNLGV